MSNIVIKNIEEVEIEALAKCLERCCWWVKDAKDITIFVQPRVPATAEPYKSPGWLEYGINVVFKTGRVMYVAMVQRQLGAAYEFHS